jgi:hypothetical protein
MAQQKVGQKVLMKAHLKAQSMVLHSVLLWGNWLVYRWDQMMAPHWVGQTASDLAHQRGGKWG